MKIINFTVCNGDFIDWKNELNFIQNNFNEFYVQSGSYVPNIQEWIQKKSFKTNFVPILNSETIPEEGRLYILIPVKYIEKQRNKILSYEKFQTTLEKQDIQMEYTDLDYIYTNNGLMININTLNLSEQDCELVCGRDFFYN